MNILSCLGLAHHHYSSVANKLLVHARKSGSEWAERVTCMVRFQGRYESHKLSTFIVISVCHYSISLVTARSSVCTIL